MTAALTAVAWLVLAAILAATFFAVWQTGRDQPELTPIPTPDEIPAERRLDEAEEARDADFMRGVFAAHAEYTRHVQHLADEHGISRRHASGLLDRWGHHRCAQTILADKEH